MNPWLAWLGGSAAMVKANRHAASKEQPLRQMEQAASELISASLDYYRDVRDICCEAAFFQIYANVFSLQLAKQAEVGPGAPPKALVKRTLYGP